MSQSAAGHNAARSWMLAITLLSCVLAVSGNAQEKTGTPARKYNGSGSCSASACHGGVQIIDIDTRRMTGAHIWQNESFTWSTQDPHFKGYTALQTPRSKKISFLLKRPTLPENDRQCLGCHALAPAPGLQARLVFPEGVSCESCHNASSDWFESHFQHAASAPKCPSQTNTANSIRLGMHPMRDAVKRSEKCLTCHVGTKDYEVNHEMIAAGHPDLLFELDLFSARMPRHWATPNELNALCENIPKDSNYEVRLWAAGQAVQLREALSRLARRADRAQHPNPGEPPKWPELSELDCFSCHHSVNSNYLDPNYDRYGANSHPKGLESWRQNRGYENRAPGSPPWNSAHYTVFRILLKTLDRSDSDRFESEWHRLYTVASQLNSPAKDVSEQAQKALAVVAPLVEKVASEFKPSPEANKPLLRQIMLRISAEADHIANEDTRSAEQAYMALDSLFRSYEGIKTGDTLENAPHKEVGRKIRALYKLFDNPSGYDAPTFARALREVNEALRSVNEAQTASQSRNTRKLQVGLANATN